MQLRTHAHPPAQFQPQYQNIDRNKRGAQDAFGEDNRPDYPSHEAFGGPVAPETLDSSQTLDLEDNTNGVQDISTRLMAHMLGLEIPGVEPSTSYYPGYEWWPRNHGGSSQQPPQQHLPPTGAYPSSTDFSTDLQGTGQGLGPVSGTTWAPTTVVDYNANNLNYSYDFGQYGV